MSNIQRTANKFSSDRIDGMECNCFCNAGLGALDALSWAQERAKSRRRNLSLRLRRGAVHSDCHSESEPHGLR